MLLRTNLRVTSLLAEGIIWCLKNQITTGYSHKSILLM